PRRTRPRHPATLLRGDARRLAVADGVDLDARRADHLLPGGDRHLPGEGVPGGEAAAADAHPRGVRAADGGRAPGARGSGGTGMIAVDCREDPNWLPLVTESLRHTGAAVVTGVLTNAFREEARERM